MSIWILQIFLSTITLQWLEGIIWILLTASLWWVEFYKVFILADRFLLTDWLGASLAITAHAFCQALIYNSKRESFEIWYAAIYTVLFCVRNFYSVEWTLFWIVISKLRDFCLKEWFYWTLYTYFILFK